MNLLLCCFISRLRSDFADRLRYLEADEFDIVLFCFCSETTRGVNERDECNMNLTHEIRVQFPARDP